MLAVPALRPACSSVQFTLLLYPFHCKRGVHLKSGQAAKTGHNEDDRRKKVVDLERREEENKRDGHFRGGRGGRGGKWRDRKKRNQ